mmetsp:Transcript_110617/g.195919  ORF Transcript_110617/g.195919 Transcript_110617/m.195919 type:complete len:121 (+) Transcript_110617:53-415(+)
MCYSGSDVTAEEGQILIDDFVSAAVSKVQAMSMWAVKVDLTRRNKSGGLPQLRMVLDLWASDRQSAEDPAVESVRSQLEAQLLELGISKVNVISGSVNYESRKQWHLIVHWSRLAEAEHQ